MLILEPSKVLQPAIVCVSEEDQSRTVQLEHVTPLEVCEHCVVHFLTRHTHPMQNKSFPITITLFFIIFFIGCVRSLASPSVEKYDFIPHYFLFPPSPLGRVQHNMLLDSAERLTPVDFPGLCNSRSEVSGARHAPTALKYL